MSNKLYEIPEDVAKVLRNTGVTVVTKHYIEEAAAPKQHEEVDYTEPKRKTRKKRRSWSRKVVEVGQHTPKELKLRGGRRFYGEKAQTLLLQRKNGIKRNVLTEMLFEGDKYHADDTIHGIACQITHLVAMGVLSYKENN